MDEIEILSQRFKDVFSKLEQPKWKYCHKNSMENFIYHLPKIKGRSEKQEIIVMINQYLDILSANEAELNMSLSEALFNGHLNYIGNKFQNRVGFFVIFPIKVLLILVPILVITYFFLLTKVYLIYAITFFLGGYLLKLFFKLKSRKVYGFGY